MNASSTLKIASLLCLIAVIFGAFGAHALRERIDVSSLENWKTATHYQFIHGIALLIVSLFMQKINLKLVRTAAIFFLVGIILFSGSLYLLSLRSLIPFNILWLGPLTPLGGLSFIAGWICMFLVGAKIKETL